MRKKYLFIGISLIPILVGLIGFAALLKSPYLGIEFESRKGKWFISSASSGISADKMQEYIGKEAAAIGDFELKEFDIVEDFDYIPDWDSLKHFWNAQKYFSETIKAGDPLTITVRTEDKHKSFETIPLMPTISNVLSNIGMMFFLGLFSLMVGLVAALKKPGDIRAVIFFFMVFSVSLIFLTFGSYTSRNISFTYKIFTVLWGINVIGFSFFPSLFLHFCLIFPREKGFARNKLFLTILYLLPVIVSMIYQPRISYLSLNLFFMACLIGGIASMIHSYITLKSAEERTQIRWVLWGVGIFVIVFLITTFIPILFEGQRLVSDRVPSLFFIFIPLSIAFSITKYRLMDIDTLFDNTLIYTITLGFLAATDIGVISFFSNIKSEFFQISEPFAAVLSVWLVIFAYIPVRNTIKRGVKRVLKREVYDLNDVTIRLSSHLISASDIPSVLKKSLEIINETLHPKGGEAFLFDEMKDNTLHLPVEDIKTLKASKHLYDLTGYTEKLNTSGVIVPVIGSTGTLGYLLLKEKYSGRLYSGEDLQLLNTIASRIGLAIENIRMREERERLSREIHDGIGGSLTNAILTIDALSKESDDRSKIDRHLKILKKLISDGLTDLRELLWALEDEEYTLKEIISHIKERVKTIMDGKNIPYDIGVDMENEGIIFSPKARLNIIRIIQESLTNTIKHAGAGKVSILIDEKDRKVTIRIKDDGKGFDPSDIHSKGYGLRNIKKRCDEIGARLDIISKPLRGTEIEINMD
jgi:signal transduction histidine kinase